MYVFTILILRSAFKFVEIISENNFSCVLAVDMLAPTCFVRSIWWQVKNTQCLGEERQQLVDRTNPTIGYKD